jgi:hypothetical protein
VTIDQGGEGGFGAFAGIALEQVVIAHAGL